MKAVDLVTFKGFLHAFWTEYRRGGRSQEDVYDYLEGIYFGEFGEHRFPSFDAFRMRRDRAYRRRPKD